MTPRRAQFAGCKSLLKVLPIISGDLGWHFQEYFPSRLNEAKLRSEEWIYLSDGSVHLLPEKNSAKMGESVLTLKSAKGKSANPT
jgi:hypothetical protein